VFLRDSSRPAARQHVFQGLGLADANERISKRGLDKFQNAEGSFPVGLVPVPQVLAELGVEHGVAVSG